MDVLRNQQSKPQHIFLKIVERELTLFLIFSNLELFDFFPNYYFVSPLCSLLFKLYIYNLQKNQNPTDK